MARPVVPIRVRGSVVRVDVARTIIAAVINVPTTAHSPDDRRIDEVGVKGSLHESALQSRLRKIIAGLFSPRILLEENYVFRNFFFMRRPLARPGNVGAAAPSAAYAAFTPTGRNKGPTRSAKTRSRERSSRRRSADQNSGRQKRSHDGAQPGRQEN